MNSKILVAVVMLITTAMFGQKSPSETTTGTVAEATVEIKYSSPRVRDRVIFGNLVPYGRFGVQVQMKILLLSLTKA